MSYWIYLLIILILLLIVIIIVYIVTTRNSPNIDYGCTDASLPEETTFLIKNINLVATNIPSVNSTYNLTFRSTGGVPFTYDGSHIRLAEDTKVGWTRVLFTNGGGYVKLDTIRENDENQVWCSGGGSLYSPNGKYIATLQSSGGLFYVNLISKPDMNSCKFTFPSPQL